MIRSQPSGVAWFLDFCDLIFQILGLTFKMGGFSRLTALAALVPYAAAQFVPAPTDLITKKGHAGIDVRYKEVPAGICEQDPDVKSYSGYADVGENEHIFW